MTIYIATNDQKDIMGADGVGTISGRFDSAFVDQYITKSNASGGTSPIALGHSADITGDTQAWFHFEYYPTAGPGSNSDDGHWLQIVTKNGERRGFIDINNGLLNLTVYDAAGTATAAAGTFTISGSALQIFDIMYEDDGVNCTMEIYIDNVLTQSVTRASTGTADLPVRIVWDHTDFILGAMTHCYSQFIIANESTVGMKMQVLDPNAVGNYNDLSASVAEVVDGDVATGWTAPTAAEKQSYTITGFTMPAGRNVHSLVSMFDVRTGLTGPQNIRPFLRISATDYNAPADITPNINNSKQGKIGYAWTTNPATAGAWTEAAIQAIEAGLEIKA